MNSFYCGTWALEAFTIEHPEKGKREWGSNLRGLLIYSSTGHVSVAINKDIKESGNPDKDTLDAMLFYAGTFEVSGTTISHNVTIASSPSRVGREMIRYASLDGDLLTLTTPQESYGTAKLVWRRIGGV
jgi:hypothetical protein